MTPAKTPPPEPRAELAGLARALRLRLAAGPAALSPAAAGRLNPPGSPAPAGGARPHGPARAPGPSSGAPPAEDDRAAARREAGLARLAAEAEACRRCPLGSSRLRSVFGEGRAGAAVMFVGEGPGFEEDRAGRPFVGKAGQLLDKMLAAIGLSREAVYIANAVKCRAMADPSRPEARGNDRPPTPEETAACRPYLEEQIRLVRPRVLVALGSAASRTLLGEDAGITRIRGHWREYPLGRHGRPAKLLPTYHPAALLHRPELKVEAWEDLKSLREALHSVKGGGDGARDQGTSEAS